MSPQSDTPLSIHLLSGGIAGLVESCCCHPLDTIKVRMQLRNSDARTERIFKNEGNITSLLTKGAFAFYKGFGPVVCAIVPKMSIRFLSFEYFKRQITNGDLNQVTPSVNFTAGLLAGITESYFVVTPFDVVKIRLQAQRHSLADPLDIPKYRNAAHCIFTILKEEGPIALYKGASLTATRQATNQAVNFSCYHEFKKRWTEYGNVKELSSIQHLLLGGLSGAMGPIANAPIDTIKTRVQKQGNVLGQSGFTQIKNAFKIILASEGISGLYKGLAPRLLRVAPGQAITFMVYEKTKSLLVFNRPVTDPVTLDE
ncbi:tricarboxylate transporter [Rozella allomycis CSF55]|uniref:Mitochondrial substrate/solute carrier domain-containing protein n=1 Tax=Rozella allomycis (strain CSF55) TaxID=988480 RepID=A0A075AYZ9_ROZAC|nr:Mitochondrial substrate/solute carrier domain-containing protein [Rozella allomycis CSF55]RKP17623.1 tricarboxylate transporter [Rozella allomycis CSF55]|eukprot:EPZ35354.1 Mitochondrial substrate/solute carrier domain-containing protein [Rozella allomycis CSF55]